MTYTPMIQQYLNVKADYQDAFLFFRLGDFYEMFFDDAEKAAQELEITLTSRDGGKTRIPMCGVPYHSARQYIAQLIEKGYKVAICEQVEDPKEAKGVVKREVVQVITPGTVMDQQAVKPEANNYITALTQFEDLTYGLAATDITTGESLVTLMRSDLQRVISEIASYACREVIVGHGFDDKAQQMLQENLGVTLSYEDDTTIAPEFNSLTTQINQEKLSITFGRLLQYLIKTQKRSLDHLQAVTLYSVEEYMVLDRNSKRNLELSETIRDKKRYGSLLWLLDKTKTAMGARLLKQWLERPLVDQKQIEHRQSIVEAFIHHFFEREVLRDHLSQIYDLERLIGRVAYGNVNARDLIQLKKSLEQIPAIIEALREIDHPDIQAFINRIDPCSDVKDMIEKGILNDPPLSVKDGGIIQDGYNQKLDEYRYVSRNGKAWIANLEKEEREATGIKSLKIGYNKVFGYYIEVTKANLQHLPENRYERKQTLTNAERYVTPELKEKEKLIFEAEDKMMDLEYSLFQEIRENIKEHSARLQTLAKTISEMDVLISFASVSEENHYVKPIFTENRTLEIKESRHPVIEKVMKEGKFVANDIHMDKDCNILLITGPNMGGKSTFMRQAALTAIMAQIGCYVAADEAHLPIFDQIFTRIGAADDLVSGQSTFMVEMLEAQYALTHATQDSLILLDEIGRGTSTYDGIAIAQAIVEYIHEAIKAKTLFSTHYHELTSLETKLIKLRNIHVSAMEEKGRVVFLHKVKEGHADKSYGIHVAELADLPAAMIDRAKTILQELETPSSHGTVKVVSEVKEPIMSTGEAAQLSFFTEEPRRKNHTSATSQHEKKVLEKLLKLDVLDMTPLDALNELYRLQKSLKKETDKI